MGYPINASDFPNLLEATRHNAVQIEAKVRKLADANKHDALRDHDETKSNRHSRNTGLQTHCKG